MRLAYLAALSTLALVGCFDDGGLDFDRVERSDDFFPDKFEMPVTLRLANVSIEAEAKMSIDGTTRTIHIVQNGVPIEEEVYVVTTESISVKSLGTGESFEPPLVLIAFPMTIGDKSEWTGKLGFAGPQHPTTAAITTSRDRPDLPTGPRETLKVGVELRIDDGSPKPALRKLDFWFAEGVGPIRRDYGNQIRMPR